ncbi:unnamed protein product [Linum trigynum]|uniref:Secreted protein n=1 Tax=Linum trigynum TaxID=586398 RepID=A0AAV2EAJ7_9ROSI
MTQFASCFLGASGASWFLDAGHFIAFWFRMQMPKGRDDCDEAQRRRWRCSNAAVEKFCTAATRAENQFVGFKEKRRN